MTFLVPLVLASPPASACGGFACDNPAAPPVLQAAERVVFGIDPDTDQVEMHVQVSYTGIHDFAWIVPVPEVPDLMLSSSLLFTQVATVTQPTFTLVSRDDGTCHDDVPAGTFNDAPSGMDAGGGYSDYAETDQYDVTVAGTQTVGPYETVTLRGASAEDVLGWLRSEGYALPNNLADLLNPYVADDAWFVALKLKTGASVGDLAPLAMKYQAAKASIPVQLTSMSATPDMRMEVYVFSDGRAVPESYLHVQINDAAINWWQGGGNYEHVITLAADEAGGHAFATDYHGTSAVVPAFHPGPTWPEAALRADADPQAWLAELRPAFQLVPPELFTALEQVFDLPAGQGQVLWGCPSCVDLSAPFDPEAATDVVVAEVFEPLDAAQGLLDRYPYLSRMTSSISAVEMTVDPVFVVNTDLAEPPVSQSRTATQVWQCQGGKKRERAERLLKLADGRQIAIPSPEWLADNGMTEFQWMKDLGDIKAQIIEQQNATGPATVLVDHTRDLFALVAEHNRLLAGCGGGCSTGAAGGSVLGVGLVMGLVRRRRISGSPGSPRRDRRS